MIFFTFENYTVASPTVRLAAHGSLSRIDCSSHTETVASSHAIVSAAKSLEQKEGVKFYCIEIAESPSHRNVYVCLSKMNLFAVRFIPSSSLRSCSRFLRTSDSARLPSSDLTYSRTTIQNNDIGHIFLGRNSCCAIFLRSFESTLVRKNQNWCSSQVDNLQRSSSFHGRLLFGRPRLHLFHSCKLEKSDLNL